MKNLKTIAPFLGIFITTQFGCIEAGVERAELDETIGHAERDSAQISIKDGHGHIRVFQENTLTIWAQAPTLDLEFNPGETEAWTFNFMNLMADAQITSDEAAVTCERTLPTRQTCTIQANSTAQIRVASADEAPGQPLRFLLFADVQKAIDGIQDVFEGMSRIEGARFVIMSGDLTDVGSAEELERFQEEMKTLPFPIYATLGNHELGTNDQLFRTYFGRGNLSFEFAGRRFTLLDSASATLPPLTQSWLNDWLKSGEGQFHAIAMHIPPLDPTGGRNAGFASRSEARALIAQFAHFNVDLTLYGHVHSFHEYTNGGIPAVISGGGGAASEKLDGIERHFVQIDISPEQISTRKFIRVD